MGEDMWVRKVENDGMMVMRIDVWKKWMVYLIRGDLWVEVIGWEIW